jgi:hypothetical protein
MTFVLDIRSTFISRHDVDRETSNFLRCSASLNQNHGFERTFKIQLTKRFSSFLWFAIVTSRGSSLNSVSEYVLFFRL